MKDAVDFETWKQIAKVSTNFAVMWRFDLFKVDRQVDLHRNVPKYGI
jgi:hypothetical protein